MLNYYCIDWLAAVLTLIGLHLISNKQWQGLLCYALANIMWLVISIMINSIGMMTIDVVFFVMNILAMIKWRKQR